MELLHLWARWYSPSTGTFLSVDPVESEPPYQYVRGNPVNLTDPSGNTPTCDFDTCKKPKPQPGYMYEKARITCFDLYMRGGSNPIERYLEKESYSDPAALLTRIAVAESPEIPEDQKLVMWIIRYRVRIGHSNLYPNKPNPTPTNLWTEVSRKEAFRTFEKFLNITVPEQTTGNIGEAIYPYDTELDDKGVRVNIWIRAYGAAQDILDKNLETDFPPELIANDGKVEDPNNDFKYAFDSFNKEGSDGGRYFREVYEQGNDYFAYYPEVSKLIWPDWNPE